VSRLFQHFLPFITELISGECGTVFNALQSSVAQLLMLSDTTTQSAASPADNSERVESLSFRPDDTAHDHNVP